MASECAFNKCHECRRLTEVRQLVCEWKMSCRFKVFRYSQISRLFAAWMFHVFVAFMRQTCCFFLCPNGDQDLWAAADCCYAQSRQNPLTSSDCLFCVSRSGRSSVGLPGRGVRSTSQHRALQQPPLRQEPQQSRLPTCGQLSAKCSGPTSGPARGLPNELRPLAGEGSLLQTYFLGRTATVRLDHRQHSCSLFLFCFF